MLLRVKTRTKIKFIYIHLRKYSARHCWKTDYRNIVASSLSVTSFIANTAA